MTIPKEVVLFPSFVVVRRLTSLSEFSTHLWYWWKFFMEPLIYIYGKWNLMYAFVTCFFEGFNCFKIAIHYGRGKGLNMQAQKTLNILSCEVQTSAKLLWKVENMRVLEVSQSEQRWMTLPMSDSLFAGRGLGVPPWPWQCPSSEESFLSMGVLRVWFTLRNACWKT